MNFPYIINKIVAVFGAEIVGENNSINREKLASIVFNDPNKLKQLNAIVHPAVKKHFNQWVLNNIKFPYLVKEAAILFESGSYKDCDSIITVSTPLETRISRVIERDKTTREKVLLRINSQLSDEERIARSQYVIINENLEKTKIQMDTLINLLKDK
jgi:dephospho-CoA kinase